MPPPAKIPAPASRSAHQSLASRPKRNVYAASKVERSCPICVASTVVNDNASGDALCSRCGLVLEGRMMSEEQEWRNFSDSGEGGTDKSRVGGINDIWLTEGVRGTSMLGGSSNELLRTHERTSTMGNQDRQLMADVLSSVRQSFLF
eukprot:Selendium_serpulae@DN6417_c1_g1_i19.p2